MNADLASVLARWDGETSRREFLKTSGLFVLGFGAGRAPATLDRSQAFSEARAAYPDPDFRQLDSWLVIHEDGTATFYVGKTDGGQGTGTAFRQMMCDELDLAFERSTLVMGRTDITVDQGGSGGSDAIERDALPAVRKMIEHQDLLRDTDGVVPRKDDDHRAELDPAGPPGGWSRAGRVLCEARPRQPARSLPRLVRRHR